MRSRRSCKRSYLDYAMSVIVGRALPDVRDGLKPVHRRILYAMWEHGLHRRQAVQEVARASSATSWASTIPTATRRSTTPWCAWRSRSRMRHPLVDGQGNFGSVDGDPPAAMRYTEVRLARLAEEMLGTTSDKETVDLDAELRRHLNEPLGAAGEVPEPARQRLVRHRRRHGDQHPAAQPRRGLDALHGAASTTRKSTIDELMKLMHGPGFPDRRHHRWDARGSGRRTDRPRLGADAGARTIEDTRGKGDQRRIIVSELPYQVNKAALVETIAELVQREEDRGDLGPARRVRPRRHPRRRRAQARRACRRSSSTSSSSTRRLQSTFGIIMLALVDGQPQVLTLQADAARTSSSTGRRSSSGARVTSCAGRGARPHPAKGS